MPTPYTFRDYKMLDYNALYLGWREVTEDCTVI